MADRQINEDIAWAVVDIETTGLDAKLDVPLEVGIKLIDRVGFVIDEAEWLVYEDPAQSLDYKIGLERGKANPFVNPMHEKSGLWLDLVSSPPAELFSREAFDESVVGWLEACGAPTKDDDGVGLGMMGNSVGSLDRPFTIEHFPRLNLFLGYRNIDISTIKELVKKLNPDLYANLKPIIGDKSKADHRVLSDIDACILEYRTYGIEFLIVGEEVNF